MSLVTMSNRHSPAFPQGLGILFLDNKNKRTEGHNIRQKNRLKTVGYVEGVATAADSYVTAFAKQQVTEPPCQFCRAKADTCSCYHIIPVVVFVDHTLYANGCGSGIACNRDPDTIFPKLLV